MTSAPAAGPGPGARPRVVVVGAGFAGLTLVRRLRRAPVDVLLVDRNNYHLFTPLLYQVASALLNPSEIAQPVRKLVRNLPNCQFRLAEVRGWDRERRRLETDRGPISYDHLVLAAGSANNYFGSESLAQHSLALKELPDALALRNSVLERFEQASWEADPGRRAQLLTFVVVGGGPTGVEFSGALSELIRLALRRDFRGVDVSAAQVWLVEARDQLLPGFGPRLRRAAARALTRRGVRLRLNSPVRELEPGVLTLADGTRLDAASVIWTAGVRGATLADRLGLELDPQGRIPVNAWLQLPQHPEVRVIGDLAALERLPMLAQVAIQQARRAADNITAALEGRPQRRFHYHDLGVMATIGRNYAVAQVGPLQLAGLVGWWLWLVVHLLNIITFRARLATLLQWSWDYFTLDRPIRLLVRARAVPEPPSGD